MKKEIPIQWCRADGALCTLREAVAEVLSSRDEHSAKRNAFLAAFSEWHKERPKLTYSKSIKDKIVAFCLRKYGKSN